MSSLYTLITQYSVTAISLMSALLLHPNMSATLAFAQPLLGTNPQPKSNIITPFKDLRNDSVSNEAISLHTTYTIQAHNIRYKHTILICSMKNCLCKKELQL